MPRQVDVLVIGLGHAGIEAAMAAVRTGASVVGLTLREDRIGAMSCNPSIGGPGKGQLVRELDALGGCMGLLADATGIHFRRLNESKGPAVRARRAICDREAYAVGARELLVASGVQVVEGEATDLILDGDRFVGVMARLKVGGIEIAAKAIVVTAGTFLGAVMHTGALQAPGGRAGEGASMGLSTALRGIGFRIRRFKTGTPPRISRRSIDFDRTELQPWDAEPLPFSAETDRRTFPCLPQLSCGVTWTNESTHSLVRRNLSRSPLYGGAITGLGPRYCPSFEDKVVRFPERKRHQLFLEPEGVDSDLVYPAGISTSLPAEVQQELLRTIQGLERAEVTHPGYAVEYDVIDPVQLDATLAMRGHRGLWLAGQVNGTSGYEEAAVQGWLAGVNAARFALDLPSFTLHRSESLIGVMVDDLISRGVDEPYRMFTSRAEHRLLLREGNAELRLIGHARSLGLASLERAERVEAKRSAISAEVSRLEATMVNPSRSVTESMESHGHPPIRTPTSLAELLRRPELTWEGLAFLDSERPVLSGDVIEEVETEIRYGGYIRRQEAWIERLGRLQGLRIPDSFELRGIDGLSRELRERLGTGRFETVAELARLPGMTDGALSLIVVHLERLLLPTCGKVLSR